MRKVLFSILIVFLAAAANAACIKCDQSTGYWCFMRTDGTKANCDSPSNAGCFTWGTCTSGGECEYGCMENVVALRFNDRMQVASVSVTVPLRRS